MENRLASKHRIESWGTVRNAVEYIAWATKSLGNVSSVLDVGAGDGIIADLLPPGVRYEGIDLGADIYPRSSKVKYMGDYSALKATVQAHSSVDLVTIFDVLEHTLEFYVLFDLAAEIAARHVMVSLPNEMSAFCRYQFLLGRPIPAHGLDLVDSKPGHKHHWLINIRQARTLLCARAAARGMILSHEIFYSHWPSTWWKRTLLKLAAKTSPVELWSHGYALVFSRAKHGNPTQ